MPIDDWQFWFVTILALVAAGFILRPLLPLKRRSTGCGSCPSEKSKSKSKSKMKTRTSITVEGERVR